MIITDLEKVARDWLTKSPMSQAVTIDKDSNTYLVVLFKGKDFDYLQIEAVLRFPPETGPFSKRVLWSMILSRKLDRLHL